MKNNRLTFILSIVFGVVGIVGTIFTITGFLKTYEKDFTIETLTSNNVIELNDKVPQLKFIYKNKDLNETKEALHITILKIANNGNLEISKTDFDENSLFGIELSNATIVDEPRIIDASSDYLKNIEFKIDSNNLSKVIAPPFILDAESFFTLKLLSKHQIDSIPHILPFGKVAGVTEFNLIEKESTTTTEVQLPKQMYTMVLE